MHRFFTHVDGKGTRDVQCQMFVETKSNGAELGDEQRDVLHMVNQCVRTTPWLKQKTNVGRFAKGHGQNVRRVFSVKNGRTIELRHYGVHLLRMSGSNPDNSEWLIWDDETVDVQTLIKLLRFDLDPDTLKPMDLRRHKRGVDDHPRIPGI